MALVFDVWLWWGLIQRLLLAATHGIGRLVGLCGEPVVHNPNDVAALVALANESLDEVWIMFPLGDAEVILATARIAT